MINVLYSFERGSELEYKSSYSRPKRKTHDSGPGISEKTTETKLNPRLFGRKKKA